MNTLKTGLNCGINYVIISLVFIFCSSTSKVPTFNSIRVVETKSVADDTYLPTSRFNSIRIIVSNNDCIEESIPIVISDHENEMLPLKCKWNIVIKRKVDFFSTYGFFKPFTFQPLSLKPIRKVHMDTNFSALAKAKQKIKKTQSIYPDSFNFALNEALVGNKLILVEFSAKWCVPCQIFKENTIKMPDVKNYMDDNYIFYNVDIESFDGIGLKELYDIELLPTILIVNSQKKVLNRYEEAFSSQQLLDLLRLNREIEKDSEFVYL